MEMVAMVKPDKACIGCGSSHPKISVFDFRVPYLSSFVENSEEARATCRRWPLELIWCQECKLGQLSKPSPPDWHFRQYWYRSGITQSMRTELHEIVSTASDMAELRNGDTVIDIGANDGTTLRFYPEKVVRVGFEPAENLQELAREGGNKIIPDYFKLTPLLDGYIKAKVVTAVSMFYDLENPLEFLLNVREVLHPEGVFVLQMNYALSMLQNTAFDNIGHEHLAYYMMSPLLRLLDQAGLFPFKALLNGTNGGSVRLYCKHKPDNRCQFWYSEKTKSDDSVEELLIQESDLRAGSYEIWADFASRVREYGDKVVKFLKEEYIMGAEIWVVGASTRGSTLLQTWGIGSSLITAASERDPRKHGKITSGTWIPIRSEEEFHKKADVGLVLPWHFKDEILYREADWLRSGGRLLFPLPKPVVISSDGVRYL